LSVSHHDKNVCSIGFVRIAVCDSWLCASFEVHRHYVRENARRDAARSRSGDSMSTVSTRRSGYCCLQRGDLNSKVVPSLFGKVRAGAGAGPRILRTVRKSAARYRTANQRASRCRFPYKRFGSNSREAQVARLKPSEDLMCASEPQS
jgi:hypothetical protein